MQTQITVERDDTVATVTLNNPEKMNVLTLAMWRDLGTAMSALSADDTLRCIV